MPDTWGTTITSVGGCTGEVYSIHLLCREGFAFSLFFFLFWCLREAQTPSRSFRSRVRPSVVGLMGYCRPIPYHCVARLFSQSFVSQLLSGVVLRDQCLICVPILCPLHNPVQHASTTIDWFFFQRGTDLLMELARREDLRFLWSTYLLYSTISKIFNCPVLKVVRCVRGIALLGVKMSGINLHD